MIKSYDISWGYAGSSNKSIDITWLITSTASKSYDIRHEILAVDREYKTYDIQYSIEGSTTTLILKSTDYQRYIDIDGRQVRYSSIDISGDQSSSQWSINAEIPDRAEYQAIAKNAIAEITIIGTTFRFEIDGKESSIESGSESYSISGRTPQHGLDMASAIQPIVKGSTAQAMASAQLAGSSVALSWLTVDWNPPTESAGDTSPIEFIRTLATAVRASVRWAPNGLSLIVASEWPVSPWELEGAGVDYPLAQNRIFVLSDSLEVRDGFNAIDVIDGSTSTQQSWAWESIVEGTRRSLHLRPLPWVDDVALLNSGGGHLGAIYQGVHSDTITEEIEMVDGKARLGKRFDGLVSVEWRYESQGSLTITESGEVTAATPGNSLIGITYTSRHHQWTCSADVPRVQVYLRRDQAAGLGRATVAHEPGDSMAPAITDALLAGIPAMRERGRGELAEYASRRNISIECPLAGTLPQIGDTAGLAGSSREPGWTGKVASLSIRLATGEMPTMTIGLERPA